MPPARIYLSTVDFAARFPLCASISALQRRFILPALGAGIVSLIEAVLEALTRKARRSAKFVSYASAFPLAEAGTRAIGPRLTKVLGECNQGAEPTVYERGCSRRELTIALSRKAPLPPGSPAGDGRFIRRFVLRFSFQD